MAGRADFVHDVSLSPPEQEVTRDIITITDDKESDVGSSSVTSFASKTANTDHTYTLRIEFVDGREEPGGNETFTRSIEEMPTGPQQDTRQKTGSEEGENAKAEQKKEVEHDGMEESLTCGICQDMFHDCIR